MRTIGILLIILFMPLILVSQTTINGNQFFELGFQNNLETSFSEVKKKRMPWVEEYILRTETSEFDPDRQEYTFRLKPSSISKRKAQKALQDLLFNNPDIDEIEYIINKKKELHKDWLKLYEITTQFKLYEQRRKILTDKSKVFEKMASAYDFNFQKIVNLRIEKSELEKDVQKLENELGGILVQYGIPKDQLDFDNIVDIPTIEVLSAQFQAPYNPVDQIEYNYDQALIQQELKLEKAKKRQFLDFAQLRYNGPHDDPTNEKISLGIGFAIPNSGNRRLNIQELQLEQKEVETAYLRNGMEDERRFETTKAKLNRLLLEYDFSRKTIDEERIELLALSKNISQRQGYNPLILLNIEERALENEQDLLDIKINIYEAYLKLLELSGKLYDDKLINYFEK